MMVGEAKGTSVICMGGVDRAIPSFRQGNSSNCGSSNLLRRSIKTGTVALDSEFQSESVPVPEPDGSRCHCPKNGMIATAAG